MRRAVMVLAVIGSLMGAESASACSCGTDPDAEPSLRGVDAAATARLIEVERKGDGQRAEVVYRLLRVYKGSNRYNLREGEKLRFQTSLDGAACGVPRQKGKRYGLRLYEHRGELAANLCSVSGPAELRRDARGSGQARAAGAGCGSQS